MCDFGEGGKEEYAGVIGLFGGNRLVLLLKRPFMATLERSHECQHSHVLTGCLGGRRMTHPISQWTKLLLRLEGITHLRYKPSYCTAL